MKKPNHKADASAVIQRRKGRTVEINIIDNRKPIDSVDHPAHYNKHPSGVECIEITRHMSFNLGNAIKYLWRTDHKGGIVDLEKAVWYIKDEINRLKSTEGNQND